MSLILPGVAQASSTTVLNQSITSQAPTAEVRTYITGSQLKVPVGGLKVGARLRWKMSLTKTAAGTAASTFDICFGLAGTADDTARVSFTKPAGTAAADEATITIEAIVRSVSATGVVAGNFALTHNLASTGHATIPAVSVTTVSSGFDNTAEELFAGVCITSGASDVVTFQVVSAELVQENTTDPEPFVA